MKNIIFGIFIGIIALITFKYSVELVNYQFTYQKTTEDNIKKIFSSVQHRTDEFNRILNHSSFVNVIITILLLVILTMLIISTFIMCSNEDKIIEINKTINNTKEDIRVCRIELAKLVKRVDVLNNKVDVKH